MNNNDGKIGKIVAMCWTVVVVLTIGITLIVVLPDWDKGEAESKKKSNKTEVSAEVDDLTDETADNSTENTTEMDTEAASETTTEATTENASLSAEDEMGSGIESEYIIDGSDSRYLTDSDLDGLDADQLRLARNEIYARHGRRFNDEELQAYFDSKSWYSGTINPDDFTESMLNDYEIQNANLIKSREDELK
jgi:hypothetical protein